jgi:putative adhesin
VTRAALVVALSLLPALAQANPKQEPRPRRHGLTLQLPDIPALPMVPEIEFPDIDVDVDLDLPQMMAQNDFDDDADSDRDSRDSDDQAQRRDRDRRDQDREERDQDGNRVKVYKLNPQRSIRLPRVRLGDEDSGDRDREATARARGSGSATLEVRGPVTFQVRAQSGEIEVVASDRQKVSVTLTGAPAEDIALYAYGDRVEPSFRGRRTLRRGKLHVELPRGSRLDISSMSGDVTAQRLGDVRIRTMSGQVKLSGVGKADVQTISGDARIDDSSGPVRLHTVSGKAVVSTSGNAPQVEFQSASGSLEWAGLCGKDCHLSAETVSGELRLLVDPKSSFELSYSSHSGELRDEMNLAVKHAPRRHGGMMSSGFIEATYGRGEGIIEADAFSGSVTVKKK